MKQDPVLEVPSRWRGFNAELIYEDVAQVESHAQRLGLPPASVEGQHVVLPELLAPRMLLRECLELWNDLLMMAEFELRAQAVFDRQRSHLGQLLGTALQEWRVVSQLPEGPALPQAERLFEHGQRLGRIGAEQGPAQLEKLGELGGIDFVRGGIDPVAAPVGTDSRAECLAEVRDVGADHMGGRRRRIFSPHLVDQPIHGERVGCGGEQARQHTLLAGATDVHGNVAVGDFEWPQDLDPHATTASQPTLPAPASLGRLVPGSILAACLGSILDSRV